MRWSRARHPRMTRNRSGHSRRLRVGDGMRSPSVWHFVKRFAPCPSGTLSGQNRHRTVPFHLHPPATHLAMQPASRLRHPLPGLQRSQRRSVRHRPHPSGVGDRNAERPRPARRNRRPAKAPAASPAPCCRCSRRNTHADTDNRRRRCPRRGRGLEESLCEPVCSLSRIHTGLNYERLCRTIRLVWLGCCGELGMPFRYMPNDLK